MNEKKEDDVGALTRRDFLSWVGFGSGTAAITAGLPLCLLAAVESVEPPWLFIPLVIGRKFTATGIVTTRRLPAYAVPRTHIFAGCAREVPARPLERVAAVRGLFPRKGQSLLGEISRKRPRRREKI